MTLNPDGPLGRRIVAVDPRAQRDTLRNRRIAPEAGWRLVDIMGAPMRVQMGDAS
jgi:hypothetical protein